MNRFVDSLFVHLKKRFRILLSRKYRREHYFSTLLEKSEYFDAKWYYNEYPDIADAGVKAEEHYIKSGHIEGRLPGPLFDEEFYLSQIRGPIPRDLPPLIHYELHGRYQGSEPTRQLDANIWWKNFKEMGLPEKPEQIIHDISTKTVTIVIPIFNGASFLRNCIDSVLKLRGAYEVILIDDYSDEVEIPELLNYYATQSKVSIVRNTENLGFTKTVNKGIREASGNDIIILNSDTVVPKALIKNLKCAAYSQDRIGTVTPLSNCAGPFSIFTESAGSLESASPSELTRLLSQGIQLESLEVPTGHGFCMYIKSTVFDSIGYLDEEAFPRGYGEENDFCFKAHLAGWKNIVDPRTFVFHHGAKSFGTEKLKLIESGVTKLNERYGDYDALINKGFSSKPFQFMKKRVSLLLQNYDSLFSQCKPRILFVIATEEGGTAKTNKDLMMSIQNEYETFLLKSNSRRISLYLITGQEELHLQTNYLNSPITPNTHTSIEYDNLLISLLNLWSIELIHVRQIAWHSIGLVKEALKLGIPTVYSIHDFYPVCPSVKLLDNENNYCGGNCTEGFGMCNIELWPKEYFSNLKHRDIKNWRYIFDSMLSHVHSIITTSEFAKNVTIQNLPSALNKPFHVIPHGRDFTHFSSLAQRPESGKNIRLLMLGTIVKSKGSDFILPILEKFSNFEIHLLGKLADTEITHPRFFEYGAYRRDEVSLEIEKINPSWGLLLSIWPETWCHTLTEMWANGVPVIAFDNGAVKERIDINKCGVLVKNANLDNLFNVLNEVPKATIWQNYAENVTRWQKNEGRRQNLKQMSLQYTSVYKNIIS